MRMTVMRMNDWTHCIVFAVACLFGGAAVAADGVGISVLGSGEARVKPDRVEIEVRASGAGELTSDALVKYQDSLRRMTSAFESLEIENLKIEQQVLAIGHAGGTEAAQAAVLLGGGGESPAGNLEVEVSRALRIDPEHLHRLRAARHDLAHRTDAVDAALAGTAAAAARSAAVAAAVMTAWPAAAHDSSATTARAAAAGSVASRSGRPTTTRSEPAVRACLGVITRF